MTTKYAYYIRGETYRYKGSIGPFRTKQDAIDALYRFKLTGRRGRIVLITF